MTAVCLLVCLLLSESEFLGTETIANLFGILCIFCLYNKKDILTIPLGHLSIYLSIYCLFVCLFLLIYLFSPQVFSYQPCAELWIKILQIQSTLVCQVSPACILKLALKVISCGSCSCQPKGNVCNQYGGIMIVTSDEVNNCISRQ